MIKNHNNCLQQFGQTAKQYKKIKKSWKRYKINVKVQVPRYSI